MSILSATMPTVTTAGLAAGYASFQLRFRALLLDAGICLAFFIIGGVVAGAVLEQYPLARSAIFVLIVSSILLYITLLYVLTSVIGGLGVSAECIDQDLCTASEDHTLSILAFLMLGGAGILIVLGWRGQLPGGRRGKPRLAQ